MDGTLVAWWDFDGVWDGMATDASGHGNDGIIYGATRSEGKKGFGLCFSGEDCITVPTSTSLNMKSGDFTVTAWFKTVECDVFDIVRKGIDEPGYMLSVWLRPRWGIKDGRVNLDVYPLQKFTIGIDGKWHQLIWSIDRNARKGRTFFDGKLLGEEVDISMMKLGVENGSPLMIGKAFHAPAGSRIRYLDEIKIYKKSMEAEDARRIFDEDNCFIGRKYNCRPPVFSEPPMVMATDTTESPVVDGRLNDSVWQTARAVSNFLSTDCGDLQSENATVRLLSDGKKIFFGFKCHDSLLNRSHCVSHDFFEKKTDGDRMEFFLQNMRDDSRYYHFEIFSNGKQRCACYQKKPNYFFYQTNWDKTWMGKTFIGDGFWSGEISIPFNIFGEDVYPGMWKANFCRVRMMKEKADAECSSWSFSYGSFHNCKSWGTMIVGGMEMLKLSLKNLQSQIGHLRMILNENPKSLSHANINHLEKKLLLLENELKNKNPTLREWKSLKSEMDSLGMQFLTPALGEKKVVLWRKNLWERLDPCERYNFKLEQLKIKRIEMACCVNEEHSTAFCITNLSADTQRVRISIPRDMIGEVRENRIARDRIKLRRTLFVKAFNGEMIDDALPELDESGEISISPFETAQVWLTIGTADCIPGIYSSNIEIGLLNGQPATNVPLILRLLPIVLPTESILEAPIFFYFNPPYTSQDYVPDFYETRHEYVEDLLKHGVKWLALPRNEFRLMCPVVNKEGKMIKPTDYAALDSLLKLTNEKETRIVIQCGLETLFFGRNCDYLRFRDDKVDAASGVELFGPLWEKTMSRFLTDLVSYIVKQGFRNDNIYFYIDDELQVLADDGRRLKAFLHMAKIIKDTVPEAKIYQIFSIMGEATKKKELEVAEKSLRPVVDVWQFYLGRLFDKDAMAFFRRTEKPLFVYLAEWSKDFGSNRFSPVGYYRSLGWYAAKYDLQGIHFNAYNLWVNDPWNDFDGTWPIVDVSVVYPGRRGPIPTKRWEAFREGLQDYKYIFLLKKAIVDCERAGIFPKKTADAKAKLQSVIDAYFAKVQPSTLVANKLDEIENFKLILADQIILLTQDLRR
ncbi:MAG: DUF4091 domain-containing protein [Verrucomicrobiae bacterium]|nr:DUF4091 domain-containing protein [Verrucomicrobiae bacterium]